MGCILKFSSLNLYNINIVTKIKKSFLKKKESVKGFFIFMTMLSFKVVIYSQIIKFSHCLNFRYHKYGIIIFQFELKMAVHAACTKKKTL